LFERGEAIFRQSIRTWISLNFFISHQKGSSEHICLMLGTFFRRKKLVLIIPACHSGERYFRPMEDDVSELMHCIKNCL